MFWLNLGPSSIWYIKGASHGDLRIYIYTNRAEGTVGKGVGGSTGGCVGGCFQTNAEFGVNIVRNEW